jgi:hypothetical protein
MQVFTVRIWDEEPWDEDEVEAAIDEYAEPSLLKVEAEER